MSVELTVLVDNHSQSPDLLTEHGLSILIRGPDLTVLFDAGATGQALKRNAEALSVDLAATDATVVSHGHYDHTGGLAAAVERRSGLDLYAHPGAFVRRWAEKPGQSLQDVSCPHSLEKLTRAGADFHPVLAPERLASWLLLSGPVGGPRWGPDTFLVHKGDDMVADGFEDEIFCLIRGDRGWTVLTGCCHRGLKNILRAAKFLAHDEPIVGIVGGVHLRNAPPEELLEVVELLKSHGQPELYACHCTGEDAIHFLQHRLGDRVHAISAGSRMNV
jgi:7,8-dihydropterin-6-yl-methyl-4-(beta-D-ribofuranosyl)aminobenzene 5'-phosphate synthase